MKAAMRQREKKEGFSFRDVLEMQLADDTSEQAVTVSSVSERKEEFKIRIELNSSLRNLLRKLNQRESLPLVQIDGLEADLRPYQAEGCRGSFSTRNWPGRVPGG